MGKPLRKRTAQYPEISHVSGNFGPLIGQRSDTLHRPSILRTAGGYGSPYSGKTLLIRHPEYSAILRGF